MSKYFNPYTDFGFKKLFGEEGSKDLLIDFLNQLLPYHHQIAELTFNNIETLPDTKIERTAFFDIYCESKTGKKFIVEMQKAKAEYFKDRAIFYTSFPIRKQAKKGKWNFKLLPIYFIAILDFEYEDELETHFDKWIYFLKNLENFDHIPAILNEPVFKKGFEIAKLARLTPEQNEQYQKSLVQYWEVKNVTDTAFKDGKAKGLAEGEARGLAKGLARGKAEILKRQLTRRFGELPDWAIATIEVANIQQLELWAEEILDAKNIKELLK